ncbi:hypothetical protein BJ742DRAFT_850254 [Cladochytrium replicatum]|nr:hypothetical protein BJ742DRAFT_850254 [Cladochytrium replicatum]
MNSKSFAVQLALMIMMVLTSGVQIQGQNETPPDPSPPYFSNQTFLANWTDFAWYWRNFRGTTWKTQQPTVQVYTDAASYICSYDVSLKLVYWWCNRLQSHLRTQNRTESIVLEQGLQTFVRGVEAFTDTTNPGWNPVSMDPQPGVKYPVLTTTTTAGAIVTYGPGSGRASPISLPKFTPAVAKSGEMYADDWLGEWVQVVVTTFVVCMVGLVAALI